MKLYLNILSDIYIGVFIGGILVSWGIYDDGWIKIFLGSLIVFFSLANAISNYKSVKALELWYRENSGKIIFSYPTKKKVQVLIVQQVLPLLPSNTIKIYYDGPSIVGDMPLSILHELRRRYGQINVNCPTIFKIIDNGIVFEELDELYVIGLSPVDFESVKSKINKIVNA